MPFDVKLSDGTVVRDVPDGTTKAQFAVKAWQNGYKLPEIRAALPRASGATASVYEIPTQSPGSAPDASAPQPSKPQTAMDVLRAHPLGGLEDAPRIAFNVLRGMNEPLLGALESVPIPAVQRWAAKNIKATDAAISPVESGVGNALFYSLPVSRLMPGVNAALRATPDAANITGSTLGRLLGYTGTGAVTGALTAGSTDPNRIGSAKALGAILGGAGGASIGTVASTIPAIRTFMMARGADAKQVEKAIRDLVGGRIDAASDAATARATQAARASKKAAASAKAIAGKQDTARASIPERGPSAIGSEAQATALKTLQARKDARAQAIAKPLADALQHADAEEASGRFINETPAYKQMSATLRADAQNAQPGSKLAAFYRQINNLLKKPRVVADASNAETNSDVGYVKSHGILVPSEIGEPRNAKDAPHISLRTLENVRRELESYQDPTAEGYDALRAGVAAKAYNLLTDAMGKANKPLREYLNKYAEFSKPINEAQNNIGKALTGPISDYNKATPDAAAAHIPPLVFENPTHYDRFIQATGDPAAAQRLARNYFAFRMHGMNSKQAANFLHDNGETMKRAGIYPEFQKLQRRLAELEPYEQQRGELSKNLATIADRSGQEARSYATLFTQIQSAPTESLGAMSRSAIKRMQLDGLIDASEAMRMNGEVNSALDVFQRTHDAKALRKKAIGVLAPTLFVSYLIHRWTFDQVAGLMK